MGVELELIDLWYIEGLCIYIYNSCKYIYIIRIVDVVRGLIYLTIGYYDIKINNIYIVRL